MMAGLTRGSVRGWCKVCFDGEMKTHTPSREAWHHFVGRVLSLRCAGCDFVAQVVNPVHPRGRRFCSFFFTVFSAPYLYTRI